MSKICRHYWCYVHAIYGGDFAVRYCDKCKRWQRGNIPKWVSVRKCPVDPVPRFSE